MYSRETRNKEVPTRIRQQIYKKFYKVGDLYDYKRLYNVAPNVLVWTDVTLNLSEKPKKPAIFIIIIIIDVILFLFS